MAGYIGSKASVVSSGAERKKVFTITTTTTSLTGLAYTPTKVHVFHNGIRLVDGTDYTATNGTSITLTNAAENGDEVVVVSYASFQVADAYTQAESDVRYVQVAGDTMTGALTGTDLTLSGGVYLGGSANKLDDYEEGTWTPSVPSGFSITTNRSCAYTKIGRLVHATANLSIKGTASDSTQLLISGLPFAHIGGNTGRGNAVPWIDYFVCGDDDGYPVAGIYDGVTWIRHWVTRSNTNANQTNLTAAMVGTSTSEYQINIQYYTS